MSWSQGQIEPNVICPGLPGIIYLMLASLIGAEKPSIGGYGEAWKLLGISTCGYHQKPYFLTHTEVE